VEVAARNQLLRARGHNAARLLAERLNDALLRNGAMPTGDEHAEEDDEPDQGELR
jgi:hypothetical protein